MFGTIRAILEEVFGFDKNSGVAKIIQEKNDKTFTKLAKGSTKREVASGEEKTELKFNEAMLNWLNEEFKELKSHGFSGDCLLPELNTDEDGFKILSINCPKCGSAMRVRDSDVGTPNLHSLECGNCGLRAYSSTGGILSFRRGHSFYGEVLVDHRKCVKLELGGNTFLAGRCPECEKRGELGAIVCGDIPFSREMCGELYPHRCLICDYKFDYHQSSRIRYPLLHPGQKLIFKFNNYPLQSVVASTDSSLVFTKEGEHKPNLKENSPESVLFSTISLPKDAGITITEFKENNHFFSIPNTIPILKDKFNP